MITMSTRISFGRRVILSEVGGLGGTGARRCTTGLVPPAAAERTGTAWRWILLAIILLASVGDASIVSQAASDEESLADLTHASPAAIVCIAAEREPDSDEKFARLKWAGEELRAEVQRLHAKYR